MKTLKRQLLTVMVENYDLDKETGVAINKRFCLYSSPTDPAMARSLAENLRRVGKSFRIMTDDGKGKIVAQWLRDGFVPDDKREVEVLTERK